MPYKLDENLQKIVQNFVHIDQQLSDPNVSGDPKLLRKLSLERSQLEPVVALIKDKEACHNQIDEIKQQLENGDDELEEILAEELNSLEKNLPDLNEKLKVAMLPRDPNTGRNVFLEIRAGTGGDEAALFVRDLFRMYTRFLEKKSIPFEIVSTTNTGLDGMKEAIILVKGQQAFGLLHLEAGGHRVQRIPETESQGRIHTSACTVAVIPEVEESEVEINANDLRIDVYRSSGPGGQSVNTTDSAVRITHIPTGLVVSCQDEKSQHKNKAKAMKILKIRLMDKITSEQHEKEAAVKKAQIGSGDRSQRIRTYNFPQNRISDHRINYTGYNLDKFIEGEMDLLLDELKKAEVEAALAAIN